MVREQFCFVTLVGGHIQRVLVNASELWCTSVISGGVPQGLVLFNIFINDTAKGIGCTLQGCR